MYPTDRHVSALAASRLIIDLTLRHVNTIQAEHMAVTTSETWSVGWRVTMKADVPSVKKLKKLHFI